MANIETLKEKVTKAEQKVEKCKATIERHHKQLEKKQQVLIKKGYDVSDLEAIKWGKDSKGSEVYWEVCDIQSKLRDIDGANKKLKDAERILEGHIERLNKELEKEDFINNNIPQVIIDFVQNWKELSYEWHIQHYSEYPKFEKELNEKVNKTVIEFCKADESLAKYLDAEGNITEENMYRLSRYNKELKKHLQERWLDYKGIEGRKAKFLGQIGLGMHRIYDEAERLEWLDKVLEEEKKRKLIELVNRIKDVVGNITDAQNLDISYKLNIDGIIIGDKGRARIQTIGAGGFNIQCWHYRTLIHEIKE